MKKKILVITLLAMAIFMLFPTIAPVFAGPPTKGTYTQVVVGITIVPAEQFLTGDIVHIRDGVGESYIYGASFPLGNPISSFNTARGQLNIVSFTGNWIGHTVDTYASGTVEGIINIKFNGAGAYVYMGPTFTFTVGTVTATLTTGDVFAGLLYDLMAVKHGTGDLAGFTTKGTSSGISISQVIVGDPNMVGISLDFETGTYSW
jgi:hypothetical protein